jgi:hypothetical protein
MGTVYWVYISLDLALEEEEDNKIIIRKATHPVHGIKKKYNQI